MQETRGLLAVEAELYGVVLRYDHKVAIKN